MDAEVFGVPAFVIAEDLQSGSKEALGPNSDVAAVAGEAEAEPAVAGAGRKFRHR